MYVKLFEDFVNEGLEEKNLIIVRGLPGSGKSTFASLIAHGDNSIICTADDYFTDEQGNYNWNPRELKTAHEVCKNKCFKLINEEEPLIILANTSVSEAHVQPYIDYAIANGYKVPLLLLKIDMEIRTYTMFLNKLLTI